MPGPIGLQGGLEHYEPTLPIDRRLLDEVGVFVPEIVILPLASFKSQAVTAGVLAREHWTRLGARARVVIPGSGREEMAVEVLAGADVIVLPGGVPNRLFGALTGTPILEMILAKWEAGAGITGSSAGAMALFSQRLNLYPPDPFRLIPGFRASPSIRGRPSLRPAACPALVQTIPEEDGWTCRARNRRVDRSYREGRPDAGSGARVGDDCHPIARSTSIQRVR